MYKLIFLFRNEFYERRDESRRSDDTYYGNARTSVAKVLMNNGTLDVEVKEDQARGKRNLRKKMFITVECQKL